MKLTVKELIEVLSNKNIPQNATLELAWDDNPRGNVNMVCITDDGKVVLSDSTNHTNWDVKIVDTFVYER